MGWSEKIDCRANDKVLLGKKEVTSTPFRYQKCLDKWVAVQSYARRKYLTTQDEEIKSLYKEAFGEELEVEEEDTEKSEAKA